MGICGKGKVAVLGGRTGDLKTAMVCREDNWNVRRLAIGLV